MQNTASPAKQRAFTLIELLVVISAIAILSLVLYPNLVTAKQKSQRIGCTSRLKQIGLAFRIWVGDNTNGYPMQVSMELGGTKEFVASGETFRHFEVMSNELNTPVILACPSDKARTPIGSFVSTLSNSNISYFVGLSATETEPQLFLAGDRIIFNGVRPRDGVVGMTSNNFSGWSTDMHQGRINVGLVDGSVQGFSSNSLRVALDHTGVQTNWLQLP